MRHILGYRKQLLEGKTNQNRVNQTMRKLYLPRHKCWLCLPNDLAWSHLHIKEEAQNNTRLTSAHGRNLQTV